MHFGALKGDLSLTWRIIPVGT